MYASMIAYLIFDLVLKPLFLHSIHIEVVHYSHTATANHSLRVDLGYPHAALLCC